MRELLLEKKKEIIYVVTGSGRKKTIVDIIFVDSIPNVINFKSNYHCVKHSKYGGDRSLKLMLSGVNVKDFKGDGKYYIQWYNYDMNGRIYEVTKVMRGNGDKRHWRAIHKELLYYYNNR